MTLLQGTPSALPDASLEAPTVKLDLVGITVHAAWPVKITLGLLVACSLLVWIIATLKLLQLGRLRATERDFERRAFPVGSAVELFEIAGGSRRKAAGARIVAELYARAAGAPIERLRAVADRAMVAEGQSARALMWLLGFVAAGAPFIGLFGTVYGIMDAFIRIGAAKTASLPVVAPAIGEALITTAIGLAAAIPAVFFYNWIDKRVADYLGELEAASAEWVALVAEQPARHEPPAPVAAGSRYPVAGARQRP